MSMWRAIQDELDRDLLPDVRHAMNLAAHEPMVRRTLHPRKCVAGWPMECITCQDDCKCEIDIVEPANGPPYLVLCPAREASIQYADTDSMFTAEERPDASLEDALRASARPPMIVSIPEIPRRDTLYEDIDEAFERPRRAFHQAQIEKFAARVELYEEMTLLGDADDPDRAHADFQNDLNAINKEAYSLAYIRAPPEWKPAPIVKHDNSNIKLMPQRRDPSMPNAWIAKKSRSIAASREVASIMSAVESPTEEPRQSPPRAEFILADGTRIHLDEAKHVSDSAIPAHIGIPTARIRGGRGRLRNDPMGKRDYAEQTRRVMIPSDPTLD